MNAGFGAIGKFQDCCSDFRERSSNDVQAKRGVKILGSAKGNKMNNESLFECPCCGNFTRSTEEYGSYEICEVCGWEDDPVQALNPDFKGGANELSLNEAREKYKEDKRKTDSGK